MVRRAVPDDAAGLADLAQRAITVTGAAVYDSEQIALWSRSLTPARLEQVTESTAVFLVEDDGVMAGLATGETMSAAFASLDCSAILRS